MTSPHPTKPTYPRRFNDKISIGALTLGVIAFVLSVINITSLPGAEKETVFNHAMKTRTLRCAYSLDTPAIVKDPQSGRPVGAAITIAEAMASQLDLKITWIEESNFATMVKDLKSERFDAICSGAVENSELLREVLFTEPYEYMGLYAFARVADNRFDHSLDAINDANVRIVAAENTLALEIAQQSYAKAQVISKNKTTPISDLFDTITDGKADITFGKISAAKSYLSHNPGTLKALTQTPVRAYPVSLIVLRYGEIDFAEAVNATLRTLQENGTVERTIKQYDPNLEQTLLLAKPYQSHDKYLW